MSEPDRESIKGIQIYDKQLREGVTEWFNAQYRRGYYLKEILRRDDGNWLCVWERTTESYGAEFDWEASPETQEK